MANRQINWNQSGNDLAQAINQFARQIETVSRAAAAEAGTAIAAGLNEAGKSSVWADFGFTSKKPLTPQAQVERIIKSKLSDASALSMVGIVFTAMFGGAAVILSITAVAFVSGALLNGGMFIATTICAALAALGAILWRSGNKKQKPLRTLRTYLAVLGLRGSCTVAELAAATLTGEQEVVSTIMDAVGKGLLPGLYFGTGQQRIYLGENAYEESIKEAPATAKNAAHTSTTGNPEVDAILAEGRQFVVRLAALTGEVKDPAVITALSGICHTSEQILTQVAKSPEKAGQIHKFMTYYLPTTLKLVETYNQVENSGLSGENTGNIKANIQSVLGTMSTSFGTLLDSLFQEEALDVSTDITVLKSLLAEEGLGGMQIS